MKDAGELATEAIAKGLEERVAEIYAGALKSAVKDNAAFLKKIADIDAGIIKPPAFYDTPEKIMSWREGFTREQMRQQAVISKIEARLNEAGEQAKPLLKKARTDTYIANRAFQEEKITAKVDVTFAQYDRRQIDILLSEQETPFTKIAYKNMGANPAITRRLANEMGQATVLGESQREIIKRIKAVTGQSQYQAQRVAQTERTRVQSQARNDVGNEAAAMGLKITKEWSARMVNTRETHAALDGVKVAQDQPFTTIYGNQLMYPGDPSAPAGEIIQCHCIMITDVEA